MKFGRTKTSNGFTPFLKRVLFEPQWIDDNNIRRTDCDNYYSTTSQTFVILNLELFLNFLYTNITYMSMLKII